MFTDCASKYPHWISACQRFAAANNMADIAHKAGLNPQTLRNKLNPDQPHELTVVELIAINRADRHEHRRLPAAAGAVWQDKVEPGYRLAGDQQSQENGEQHHRSSTEGCPDECHPVGTAAPEA